MTPTYVIFLDLWSRFWFSGHMLPAWWDSWMSERSPVRWLSSDIPRPSLLPQHIQISYLLGMLCEYSWWRIWTWPIRFSSYINICMGRMAHHSGGCFYQDFLDGIVPYWYSRCKSLGPFYSHISTATPSVTHWSWLLRDILVYSILLTIDIWKSCDSDLYYFIPASLWILGIWSDSHIRFRDLTQLPLSPVQQALINDTCVESSMVP